MLFDEVLHLALGEGVDRLGKLKPRLTGPVLDELVGTEALMALAAVHKGIGKAAEMAGGDPRLRVHEYRRVETDVIAVLLHELLPPRALDVVFKLHAEGAVIPGVRKAAVDLASGEDEAAVLAQRHDPVHCFFLCFS